MKAEANPDLSRFVGAISGFPRLSHADKIRRFIWFLQRERGMSSVTVQDVRKCYDQSHLDPPGNLSRSMAALTEKKPPDLLKQGSSFRLHASRLTELDRQAAHSGAVVHVEKSLASLPGKLTNDSEQEFLKEALVCYRHGAYRAAIVMSWNLAFDHLLHWVASDAGRLAAFNAAISKRTPKKAFIQVVGRADFEDLKEDEVIDIAATIPGITSNMKRVLKEKLGRRNRYAHPSTLAVDRAQVDDAITDLVNNVILKLP